MLTLYKNAEEISAQIDRVAREIEAFYDDPADDSPVLAVCVLKGAALFFSDLTRRLQLPLEFEFVYASSYGNERESSGQVELRQDVARSVAGRRVLIVEDVVDTGVTLAFLRRHFLELGAKDVAVAVAFDKPMRRKVDVGKVFRAIEVEDRFLVGYGLDDAERYRNLPDLWFVE